MSTYPYRHSASLLFAAVIAGCGGGAPGPATSTFSTKPGTASTPPANSPDNPPGQTQPPQSDQTAPPPPAPTPILAPTPVPVTDSASMTMSCADGPAYQCSGGSIVKSENGVTLTSSGVQVYGKSTSDLKEPNSAGWVPTGAFGLVLSAGGIAEIRLARDAGGATSQAAVLLNNLGLSWDGRSERPQIVETFNPTQGRVQLDSKGALSFSSLPASSDLKFYDYAVKGTAGTQKNYANNRYFPRSGNPSRCDPPSSSCPTTETTGIHYRPGDWRTGGSTPDMADANRVHGDGDIHAGDGLPDQNGNATVLPGGSGPGVPFPGSKGYRTLDLWSFAYANLAAWLTQDTIQIGEWGALNEHNKNRRGMAAFGAVSDPFAIPASGAAIYSGTAYGWYSRNGVEDPSFFNGPASVTVNFVSREVVVTIADTVTSGAAGTSVPVALRAATTMGAAGTIAANYMTGPVDNGTLKGGLSGRHFGPVLATGTSGKGAAEIGGAFSLSNSTTGAVAVGGFIARKQ